MELGAFPYPFGGIADDGRLCTHLTRFASPSRFRAYSSNSRKIYSRKSGFGRSTSWHRSLTFSSLRRNVDRRGRCERGIPGAGDGGCPGV